MRRYKVFFANGILITLTSLLMRTVGVSFNVYISNKVGAEAVGTFQLVMAIYLFTITLATSGINLAASKMVAEELALNPNFNSKKIIRHCLIYSLLLGSFACLLLCLASPFLTQAVLHDKLTPAILYIIAFSLPFIAMSASLNGYFTALRKATKNAATRVFEQFIKIVSTCYFLVLLFPPGIFYACLALVLGETISEIMSFLFVWILYRIDIRKNVYPVENKSYTKRLLHITIPISITSYLRSGLSSLKQIMIPARLEKSGLSCDTALASYGKINGMVLPMIMFPEVVINSFSSLLIPEFSYYFAKKATNSIQYIITKIFKISLLFSIGIIGVFLFFAEPLAEAIYHDLEIATYLKILCPLIILMYLDNAVDCILKGIDKQLGVMFCNLLDSFVSVVSIYFLLPIFGIYGYLCVIFISEILNSGISIWQLWRAIHFKISFKNWIIKPIFSILFSHWLIKILPFSPIVDISSLVLQISVFIIFYLFFLLINNVLFPIKKVHGFYSKQNKN